MLCCSKNFEGTSRKALAGLITAFILLWGPSCDKKSPNGPPPVTRWVASNEGLGNLSVNRLAVHPDDPDIIFAGTFNGLYRSTDKAVSWTRVDSGWTQREVTAIAFDPLAGDVVYIGTRGDGVYKSTDGGDHWERLNTGLTDLIVWGMAVDPNHPDTVFAGLDGGICRTYDGADSAWTKVYWYQQTCLAIDPQNSRNIYAGGKFNNLHRSLEGGDNGTWGVSSEGIAQGGPESRIQWIAIDPRNPLVLYAASTNNGLHKSINRAGSWTRKDTGVNSADVHQVTIDPSNSDILYVAADNGIYRSLDAAESWEQLNDGFPDSNPDARTVVIDPLEPDRLYAGTWGDGVFTWKEE
jgi:hypothetical protein